MGYLRTLKVSELKEEIGELVVCYNKQFNTSFEISDIYKIPKMNFTWDRIIAKIKSNENEKLISVRLFGARGYYGFELIDYSNDMVYEFNNKKCFTNLTLAKKFTINDYLKENVIFTNFNDELKEFISNIKANNIKRRISRK